MHKDPEQELAKRQQGPHTKYSSWNADIISLHHIHRGKEEREISDDEEKGDQTLERLRPLSSAHRKLKRVSHASTQR